MKKLPVLLTAAALLGVVGWWFAQPARHAQPMAPSDQTVRREIQGDASGAGHILQAPDPTRHFTDFTPEQRVEFARRGHGPGG